MKGWRTAIRIARREARKSWGRSALVVALIALPVACLSFAAASYDMFRLTGAEKADRTMGTTDARVRWPEGGPVAQTVDGTNYWSMQEPPSDPTSPAKPRTEAELRALLPAGSTLLSVRRGTVRLETATGIGELNAVAVDATDPRTAGYVRVLDGRAPTAPAEVALSEEAMQRLGVGLGGTIRTADGDGSYTVVGLIEFPSSLEQWVLFAPITGDLPAGLMLGQDWFVESPVPIDWAKVRELNRHGIVVSSREVFLNPPAPEDTYEYLYGPGVSGVDTRQLAVGVLVGGLALLEVVLLAGPAFAVGAKRRRRQLGLVAANGGTPAHLRRIVLADGLVLGAVAAVVGIAAGIAAAFVARPYIEELVTNSRAGGFRVYPAALAVIALLAVITGLVAALVPAFTAAREHVLAALTGRRGMVRSRKRWLVLGIVLTGVGVAVVVGGTLLVSAPIILAGLVLGELGLILCTPALIGLIARVGRFLPLAPRIALRGAARNRDATAPAISAVMAAVAGSVAIGLYVSGSRELQAASYQQVTPIGYVRVWLNEPPDDPSDPKTPPPPSQSTVEQLLRSALPVTDVKTAGSITCADGASKRGAAYCWLDVQMAPEHVCPYVELSQERPLTRQEQAAARRHPNCDPKDVFSRPYHVMDDGSALPLLTGAPAKELAAAVAALRSGHVVVTDPRYVKDERVSLVAYRSEEGRSPQETFRRSLPAHLLTESIAPLIVMPPEVVAEAGLSHYPGMMIAATSRMPTQAERDRFAQLLIPYGLGWSVEDGPQITLPVEVWLLTAAAALITLGAAAVGTGLAAAEGRAELSTLAAVGASPGVRRRLSLSQSGVIAVLGSLLGTAAGFGAGLAIIFAINLQTANQWPSMLMPVSIPWLTLGIALLVVPAIAMLGAGALVRSRLPIERRL